jgi:hypothetical protein
MSRAALVGPNWQLENHMMQRLDRYFSVVLSRGRSVWQTTPQTLLRDCEKIVGMVTPRWLMYSISLKFAHDYRFRLCLQVFGRLQQRHTLPTRHD